MRFVGGGEYVHRRHAGFEILDGALVDHLRGLPQHLDLDAILVVNPFAVMKNAPHPNAARLFANFYFSREYSQALVETYNFPMRSDVRAANGLRLDRIKYYLNKVDRLAVGIPEVVAKWRQTFGV